MPIDHSAGYPADSSSGDALSGAARGHTPADRAESLFAEALADAAEGEPPALDDLIAGAPELEEEFRRLHAGWALFSEALDEQRGTHGDGQANDDGLEGYRIIDELGSGGMGTVHRVWDPRLHRHLALKIASSKVTSSARTRARFLDEAQVTGQLDHPGIVPVHEVGIDGRGRPWFTMPIVDGDDLGQVFKSVRSVGGDWSEADALRALVSVAETLAYAHQKGVLHRDLKPANVMVGRFGQVYVMDWGLSRVVEDRQDGSPVLARSNDLRTLDGSVLGTPSYMSPEQARAEECTHLSDVYSLGAMLYELLVGEPPYDDVRRAGGARAIVEAVKAGPPRHPRQLARDAAPELCSIAWRAMSREPSARYPSASALGDDLRAFLEERVVTAHRKRPWTSARKWLRRNRSLATALAAVLIALSLAGAREWRARSVLEQSNADLTVAKAGAEEAKRLAERASYEARIGAAQANIELGQSELAVLELERCAPDARGWEWSYLNARIDSAEELVNVGREIGNRNLVRISEDRRWFVATDGFDKKCGYELFDLESGRRTRVPSIRDSHLFGCGFNNARNEFLTVDTWGWLARWSLEETPRLLQKVVCRSNGGRARRAFDLDATGQRVAVVMRNGRIQVRDAHTLAEIADIAWAEDDAISALRLGPGGDEIFVITEAMEFARLRVATGAVLSRRAVEGAGRIRTRSPLCVSPDGSVVAVGLTTGKILICEGDSLETRVAVSVGRSNVLDLAFSPSGESIVSISVSGQCAVWDVAGSGRVASLEGSSRSIVALDWPSGRAANGAAPGPVSVDAQGQVFAWGAEQQGWMEWSLSGRLPETAEIDVGRRRLIATQSEGVSLIRSLENGHLLGALPLFRGVLKDARMTAVGGDLLCHYWHESNELVLRDGDTFEIKARTFIKGRERSLVMDGVGARAIRCAGGTATTFLLPSLEIEREFADGGVCVGAAFDPDGETVLLAYAEGRLERRALSDGSVVVSVEPGVGRLSGVAASPAGGRIAVAGEGAVAILDARDLTAVLKIETRVPGVATLSFSLDGTRLALGKHDRSVTQGVLALFDPETGRRCATLGRSDRSLYDARFALGSNIALARTFEGSVVVMSGDPNLQIDMEPLGRKVGTSDLVKERAKRWPMTSALVHSLASDQRLTGAVRTAAVARALRRPNDLEEIERVLDRLSQGDPQLSEEPELCLGMVELFNLMVGVDRAGPYLACVHAAQGRGLYASGVLVNWKARAKPDEATLKKWIDRANALSEAADVSVIEAP